MKKILIVALSIILVSCTVDKKTDNSTDNSIKRIKIIEYSVLEGHAYMILNVDSQEYLCNGSGGIVKLEHGRN